MKLTIREIIGMSRALPVLCAERLPTKVKYWLSRDCDTIQKHPALKQFVNAQNELVEKYGVKDKDGTPSIPPGHPNMKPFNEEVEALLDMEEEADLHPCKLAELGEGPIGADLTKLLKLITPD